MLLLMMLEVMATQKRMMSENDSPPPIALTYDIESILFQRDLRHHHSLCRKHKQRGMSRQSIDFRK